MKDIERYNIADRYETAMESRKWQKEIPFLKFKEDWEVKVSPPFGKAVVRFEVSKGTAHVSVYLDCYNFLGHMPSPYWEIYPYKFECFRCEMNETELLITTISESLEAQLTHA